MQKIKKRILGIDPGLETTGISVIEVSKDQSLFNIYCGCIETHKDKKIAQRLFEIYSKINEVIFNYNPYCMAIEEIFFSSNAKTAISIGEARGVALVAAYSNELEVYEYTPLELKQAIVGYGRATKNQIKYMVKIILGVKEEDFPKKDDAWDSLAIAICHANSMNYLNKTMR